MVSSKKKSKLDYSFLSGTIIKVILAIIAISSFTIAFGLEKIQQFISLPSVSNSACLDQFYRDIPPYLAKESLLKNTYPLCFNGFNVMYSGVSKTPLWVAEALTPQRLSQKIPREDSFHEESKVEEEHRATLSDYKFSGYIRGRMAPNADMPNRFAQNDSFSLANVAPIANLAILSNLEYLIRGIVLKENLDIYVVTGPVYAGKKLKTIGNGVIVPTAIFKAVYIPTTGAIGAYYLPNNNSLQVKVVSVCYLEEQLSINLFPQLTEEQKRNTYNLPLTVNEVRTNKVIDYSYWDAESQCAEDVPTDKLTTLQKQFKLSFVGTQSN